jgi:hypothetical protein
MARRSPRRPARPFTPWRVYRPRVEWLESRIAPATVNWINAVGGDWDLPANWDSGKLPGAGDDVVISQTGITITHSTAASDAIHSLTSQANLSLSAGALSIATAATLSGPLTLAGAALASASDLTLNGGFIWSSGTLNAKGTITAQGGLTLGDGMKVLSGGTLNVPGPLTWTGGDVILQNGATWGVPANRADLAPYAVLQTSNVTAPALTVGDPAQVTVSWTVTNTGTGTGVTHQWTDEVIATTDPALGHPQDEIVLDRLAHDGFLSPNQSYNATDTFTLSLIVKGDSAQPLQGRYHLFVRADTDSQLFMNEQRANTAAEAGNLFDVSPKPFADLVITQVSVPASGQTGQPLHITWQVLNQGIGTTDTQGWSDTISLATDPNGTNIVAKGLFSADHVGALAASEGYQRSADVTLPQNLASGAYYVVVQTADSNSGPYQFIHNDDKQMVSATAVQVTQGASLSLSVDPNMVLPDLPVAAGSAIDVSWTVSNDGVVDATATRTDTITLVRIGSPGSANVGSFQDSRLLAAGKTLTRTAHIALTDTFTRSEIPPGVYRVQVSSSMSSAGAFASAFANSLSTLRIEAQPQADLQVTELTAPPTVHAGETIAADFTVTNLGTVATASSWNDVVFLSLAADPTTGATIVASLPNQSALGAGESYQVHTDPFTIPLNYGGPAYVIAKTGDGATFSQPINVIPIAPADLVVSNVEAPDQAFTNGSIKVRYTVTNRGLGPTDVSNWTDQIWLSHAKTRPDMQAPRRDQVLLTVSHQGVLQVGESYTSEVDVPIPGPDNFGFGGIASGEYFLTVQTDRENAVVKQMLDGNINPDDPHELNSDGYKARPITILGSRGVPDLAVTSVTAQASAVGGDSLGVQWTVQNNGVVAVDNWQTSVYLSNTPALETPGSQPIFLGLPFRFASSVPLNPGQSMTFQPSPLALRPEDAGKYVIVRVGTFDDPTLADNELSAPTNVTPRVRANLHVSSVTPPASSPSGESITVHWTVTNDGGDVWSGDQAWTDYVYVSPDSVFYGNRATLLGTVNHQNTPALGAGQSYDAQLTAALPKGINGTFSIYVVAAVNPLGGEIYQVAPSDRRQHIGSTSLNVIYAEPALQISNLSTPATASTGDTIQVDWTVTNLGSRATRESFWFDTVYLSRDPSLGIYADTSFSPESIALGSFDHGVSLSNDAGNNSYNGQLNVTLPQGISGDFYIVVFTDGVSIFNTRSDVIPEFQGEGRHIMAVPLHIDPKPLPAPQVSNVIIPEHVTPGQPFDVTYTVTNNGSAPTAFGFWQDAIYLSSDPVFDSNHATQLAPPPGGSYPFFNQFSGLAPGQSYTNTAHMLAPLNLSGPFYVIVRTGGGTPIPSPPGKLAYNFGFIQSVFDAAPSARPLLVDPLPPPELQVDAVSLVRNAATVGSTLDVTWTVRNSSSAVASASYPNQPWSDAVYLSEKPVWDASARFLGSGTFPGVVRPGFFFRSQDLQPGESYSVTGHFTLPVVAPGHYFAIVRPDARDELFASPDKANDQGASATTVSVDAATLTPGVPAPIDTNVKEQLFRVNAPAGQTLRVRLRNSTGGEVLVRSGSVPSDEAFDATSFGTADTAALIPTTVEGAYYVLVRGGAAAGGPPPTLLAEFLPLSITDVATDTGGDSRYVTTTITGAMFQPGALVKLVRPGFAEFEPVRRLVVDGAKIVATFDLRGAPHGLYDVKVINPDGGEAVAPYRYLADQAIEPDVTVGMGGPFVIQPGDTGTFTLSVHTVTNLDAPYVFFQFGQSANGPQGVSNPAVFNFRYVDFSSNLGGSPDDPALASVPWTNLPTTVTTSAQNLAPGYVYNFATGATVPFTFTATVYPGLKALMHVADTGFGPLRDELYARYPQLRGKLDNGPEGLKLLSPQLLAAYQELASDDPDADPIADLEPPDVSFTFQVNVSATVLTRDEFVQRQSADAERLRQAVLNDPTASPGLIALASDHDAWVMGFLAALEQTRLLRPDDTAPPVDEDPKVVSLIATLASGILAGPAGQQIITNGDLVGFFSQVRKWYDSPPLPDNLNLSHPTHTERFNVYVPFDDDNEDEDFDSQHPEVLHGTFAAPDFGRFLNPPAMLGPQAALAGPQGGPSVPTDQPLPYTVQFTNPGTTPVGEVRIITKLDGHLDPHLFRLGDVQLGDIQIHVPDGVTYFQHDFDYTRSKGFILRVSAGLDSQPDAMFHTSNTASWLFQAIDPATGKVLRDPAHGLLPPTSAGAPGSGFVSYAVKPADGVASGASVKAVARVLFDFGTPNAQAFDTNTAVRTIDLTLNGSGVNLGSLPSVTQTPEDPPPPPPPPPVVLTTNPLFTEAAKNVPAPPSLSRPSEFRTVLHPFRTQSFATGIPASEAGIGPLAIVVFPDHSVLASGGPTRGQLYRFGVEGGDAGAPLARLPYPIFDMALDAKGNLWATTGGGPLLRLDPNTGAILDQFGDGLTLGLAVQPGTGLIYVASGQGIEIFDPAAHTFHHYSNARVEDLAFAPDGSLWATSWPERGDVVRFGVPSLSLSAAKPSVVLHFDDDVDSLAFGQDGTALQNLLFISHNDGTASGGRQPAGSVLTMVDLARVGHGSVQTVNVATGGSRGDVVKTTADGRVLLSQSLQIDVLSPLVAPRVAHINPPPDATVILPLDGIGVTFDSDMQQGDPADPHSVLNPANYQLIGDTVGPVAVRAVNYDAASRTASLSFDALAPDHYVLVVSDSVRNTDGLDLAQKFTESFAAVGDLTALVQLSFFNARSDRADGTISYDVSVTNKTDRSVVVPLTLELDPSQHYDGVPEDAAGRTATGTFLIDLSASVPSGILAAGQTTIGRTITVSNPTGRRVTFDPSVTAMPSPVAPPVFTSQPLDEATAGQPYSYQASAVDPQGETLSYVLALGPSGMSVDPATGLVTWSPTASSPAQAGVVLNVYDALGVHSSQAFVVQVDGVAPSPVFDRLPAQVDGKEGQPLSVTVHATDPAGTSLLYWANNLPGGATFDPATGALSWTPDPRSAGTYTVQIGVSDSLHQTLGTMTLLIAPGSFSPTLAHPPDRTVRENDVVRIAIQGSDPDGGPVTYSSNFLPDGATLDPNTGLFTWTPTAAGVYPIPFTVSNGTTATTQTTTISVLHVEQAPIFGPLGAFVVQQGHMLSFRTFAFDPHNPGFVPQDRLANGNLTPLEGTAPTVTYTVSGLPPGATFDADTALFTWTPAFNTAPGDYRLTFTATVKGDGSGPDPSSTLMVPIHVLRQNLAPVFDSISDPIVQRGQTLDVTVRATDPHGDPLLLTARGSNGYSLPPFITFTDNHDGTGLLHFAPTMTDRSGSYIVLLTATDNGGGDPAAGRSAQSEFFVTVAAANDPPHLLPIADTVALVGQPLLFAVRARDLDQDALTFSVNGLPAAATLSPNAHKYGEALFTWTPTAADIGVYSATFTVTDNGRGDPAQVLSDQQTIRIAVRTSNAAPVFASVGDQTIAAGQTLTVSLSATDPDGDPVSYSAANLPLGASLDPKTGVLSWTPTLDQAGNYSGIVVTASDGNLSTSQTIAITVTPTNRPPVLESVPPMNVLEGGTIAFTLKGADEDGDSLTYAASSLPAGASLDLYTGRFVWSPAPGQAGDYVLHFSVTDPAGLT